jgi:putative colanic acid biosynthesis UDP-glucose lipid carrier transferase
MPFENLCPIELDKGVGHNVNFTKNLFFPDNMSIFLKNPPPATCPPSRDVNRNCAPEKKMLSGGVNYLGDIPAIALWESPFLGLNAVMKRTFDIVLASVILVLISPAMLAIAVAVKLTSPGPVLFVQKRYGLNGQPINILKFRTMTVCESGENFTQCTHCDPRVTPVGAFLRRYSLDEFPQFLNVLEGSMSIVGLRPHAVAMNEEYRKLVSGYMLRHKVKPGITGLAQVNGFRGPTETLDKMQNRVSMDLEYIRTWTPLLDLKIILRTITGGFTGTNAC